MKISGRLFITLCLLVGLATAGYAADAQEKLFVFPDAEPLREHHAPKVLRVQFSKDIDWHSFRVHLNDRDVTGLVEPGPGEREVALPFTTGLNRVVFSARRMDQPQAQYEDARLSIRYRPENEVGISATTISIPHSEGNLAQVEAMMKAMREGDHATVERIRNELNAQGIR